MGMAASLLTDRCRFDILQSRLSARVSVIAAPVHFSNVTNRANLRYRVGRGRLAESVGQGDGVWFGVHRLVPRAKAGDSSCRVMRALTAALQQVTANREASTLMAQRAATWSQKHSLEGLREALRTLLQQRWP
jgi:hypothetical protein